MEKVKSFIKNKYGNIIDFKAKSLKGGFTFYISLKDCKKNRFIPIFVDKLCISESLISNLVEKSINMLRK